MKKVFSLMSIFILIPLAACSLGINTPQQKLFAITPTKSGEQMQTEISQMLTQMPTTTGQPSGSLTATQALPTIGVVTATAQSAAPTNTPPEATATLTPQPQPTATQQNTAAPAAAATTTPTAANTSTPTNVPTTGGEPPWLPQVTPVTDNMDSDRTWNWPIGQDDFTRAVFASGMQEITALTTKDGWRLANPAPANINDSLNLNIYLRATFKIEKCHTDSAPMADHYGLIVRVPQLHEPDKGYLFGFNCNGEYSLRSWEWNGADIRRQDMLMLINWTPSNFINAGANRVNVMGIEVINAQINLYANGHLLPSSYNFNNKAVGGTPVPQLYTGFFGVFAGSRTNVAGSSAEDFTIWVDDMSFWLHP